MVKNKLYLITTDDDICIETEFKMMEILIRDLISMISVVNFLFSEIVGVGSESYICLIIPQPQHIE